MHGQSVLRYLDLETYRIREPDPVLTPALIVYPEIVDANVRTTLRLLDGDGNRWRPHIKTAKLASIIQRLVQYGVTNLKCATTLELWTACKAGALDVLVAYPVLGANARRVLDIARLFPWVRISVLVDALAVIDTWPGSEVEIFVDVNPGMNRTGIDQERIDDVKYLARSIQKANLTFRGLHYYDGQLGQLPSFERTAIAHRGYNQLIEIVATLERDGISVTEVITSGTETFHCTLSYSGFRSGKFIHRVSPGTLVYADLDSLGQLPLEDDYRPAVLVLSRVVSRPTANRLTCDAGHKVLAIDCGVPNCGVLGRLDLQPGSPSEEHLPIDIPRGSLQPENGEFLYLIPRHVCPTVNNFDDALIVSDGRILGVERVSARGRESPLLAVSV